MDYFDKVIRFDPVNNYFVFSKQEFIDLKANITKEKINLLINELNELFVYPFMTVTSKEKKYQVNDPHNYVSLGTYWWKSDTETGLPYHVKDGYANPEGAFYDKDKFRRLAYIVYYAALLYYLTDDRKYYTLLKNHCVYWFLNEETRMNPHMNHAQFIPGINQGRAQGIIDYSANFAYSLHILTHLNNLGKIEESFYNDLCPWMNEFKTWLQTSENGIEEFRQHNNHGTMYDFGLVVLELFLQNDENLKELSQIFLEKRINPQITNDGLLLHEIKRTKSKSYCLMTAKGFTDTLKLFEDNNIEIDRQKIQLMQEWLKNSLVLNEKEWPYKQITVYDKAVLMPFITEYNRTHTDQIRKSIPLSDVIFKIPFYLFT